jgi:DnaJ-like protein/uncharacterized protein DUF4388
MKSAHPEDATAAPGEFSVMLSGSSIELKALALRLEAAGAKLLPVPEETSLEATAGLPDIVLCDLASAGALDLVERFYATSPPERQPHLIALGTPRGSVSDAHAALLLRARSRFRRPLDIQGIADELLNMLRQPRASTRVPQSQADLAFGTLKARSQRAPRQSTPATADLAPSSHPSSGPGALLPEEAVGAQSRHLASPALEHSVVSPELETLLAEAERRVQAQIALRNEPLRSTPPNGANARLSDDMWDALAEPLDEDVDNAPQELSMVEPAPASAVPPSASSALAPERSLTPLGDSTIPPHLWENPLEEATGSHTPGAESEQTNGSLSPVTAAGNSAAPPTLAPGPERPRRGNNAPAPRPDIEPAESQTPEPPSTTPPGAKTRSAETLPPRWAPPRALSAKSVRPPASHEYPSEASSGDASEASSQDASPAAIGGKAAQASSDESTASPHRLELPGALVRGAPALVIGRAVRQRFTGCLAFEVDQGLRRVVFKDGDVVIAASAVHGESLVSFLTQRGDVAADTAAQIEHRIPVFGRHAGAALIARGLLEQGELWPVLRSHAEWVLCQLLLIERGGVQTEYPVPERLATEPAVFGGATGAEVLVEAIQRAVPPAQASAYLGSDSATISKSGAIGLLSECALSPRLAELVKRAESVALSELFAEAVDEPMLPCVLHALCVLDVIKISEPPRRPAVRPPRLQKAPPDRLDDEALRAKVQARKALVDEGDYFALLGVPRQATGYDIRRSYLELRRQFEPGQVLRPNTLDLENDVATIVEVLDEAYEILRDQQRRERYRRAIESTP